MHMRNVVHVHVHVHVHVRTFSLLGEFYNEALLGEMGGRCAYMHLDHLECSH